MNAVKLFWRNLSLKFVGLMGEELMTIHQVCSEKKIGNRKPGVNFEGHGPQMRSLRGLKFFFFSSLGKAAFSVHLFGGGGAMCCLLI